eukprot:5766651-Prymnesium_polylepis.2
MYEIRRSLHRVAKFDEGRRARRTRHEQQSGPDALRRDEGDAGVTVRGFELIHPKKLGLFAGIRKCVGALPQGRRPSRPRPSPHGVD